MQKHGTALGRPPAAQVEEALVGSQPGSRRKVGGCGVDDKLRAGDRLLQLVHLHRAAADNLEILAQASCLLEVARDHPDFGGRLQGGGNGPSGAARSDDRGAIKAPTLPAPASGGGHSSAKVEGNK